MLEMQNACNVVQVYDLDPVVGTIAMSGLDRELAAFLLYCHSLTDKMYSGA